MINQEKPVSTSPSQTEINQPAHTHMRLTEERLNAKRQSMATDPDSESEHMNNQPLIIRSHRHRTNSQQIAN